MSTCVSNHGDESYPSTGYNSCWDWVASLPPAEQDVAASVECSTNETSKSSPLSFLPFKVKFHSFLYVTVLAGSDFVPRKKEIQGLGNGARNSTTDIYQLAQATRMARERHSVVSVADGSG